jgi:hypothetical protein
MFGNRSAKTDPKGIKEMASDVKTQMSDAELRAVERIADVADRIEEFRAATDGRKPIPATLLNQLRIARRHVRQSCGI